jgi:hypothetical protein
VRRRWSRGYGETEGALLDGAGGCECNGKPAAVLISPDDLEGLEETLDILSDKETLKRLRQSDADIEAGRVEELNKDEALKLIKRSR